MRLEGLDKLKISLISLIWGFLHNQLPYRKVG
jgi:hypothetical protein